MDSFIGQWIIRRTDPASFDVFTEHGKAHLCQSEIVDRLVMACGRQLKLVTRHGEFGQFVARRLETRCQQCT